MVFYDVRSLIIMLQSPLFYPVRPQEVEAEAEGLYGQPVNSSPEVVLSRPKEVMGTLMAAVELEEESQ